MRQQAENLLWVLTVVLALLSCGEPPPPPPSPVELPEIDTSAMEPQVAAKIESARHNVRQRSYSAQAWGQLGMIYQAHALYSAAVACYDEAIERQPDDERWLYLAALAQQKEELSAAIGYFEAAARLAPRNPAFYVNFGDALMRLGETDRARQQYAAALEQDPRSTHALYGLGQAELAQGRPEAALEHLLGAAEIAPYHGEVHALLAQIHHRRGEAEAARLAELRAKAHPQATRAPDPVAGAMKEEAVNSRAYTERGLRLVGAGRFAEAEETFRRVLEIRPDNARDFANLGGALARQGRLDEAVAAYRNALRADPRDPYARNNLGMALADQGRLDEAVEQLEEAVRIDPSYAEAHDNLGLVRFRQGRADEAVAHHQRALALEPSSVDAHTHLGTALAAGGRLAAAADHWRQALAIDGRHLPALYNLSVALAREGRHEEAIARLRQGFAVAPNSSRLVSLLAWELATAPDGGLRDGAEARQLAERLHQAYPNQPSSSDVLAAALAETGDFEEAVRVARQGLQLAQGSGQTGLAQQIEGRLAGYQRQRPFRQSTSR